MTTLSKNCTQCVDGNFHEVQGNLYLMFRQWFRELELKAKVNQERRQLLNMSDAMLNDMGLTRAQANAEAYRVDLPVERLNAMERGKC